MPSRACCARGSCAPSTSDGGRREGPRATPCHAGRGRSTARSRPPGGPRSRPRRPEVERPGVGPGEHEPVAATSLRLRDPPGQRAVGVALDPAARHHEHVGVLGRPSDQARVAGAVAAGHLARAVGRDEHRLDVGTEQPGAAEDVVGQGRVHVRDAVEHEDLDAHAGPIRGRRGAHQWLGAPPGTVGPGEAQPRPTSTRLGRPRSRRNASSANVAMPSATMLPSTCELASVTTR